MTRFVPPTRDEVRAIRAEADRLLTMDEVRALDAIPLGDEERAEYVSLIDWFCRRYPTAEDRLRYARRAYARWAKASPPIE